MNGNRFWIITFLIIALGGGFFVYQTRHADYDIAVAQLSDDDRRLDEIHVLLAQEAPLTRVYRTLSAKYLRRQMTTARTESNFTRIIADVAAKHGVKFVDATFHDAIPPSPAHIAAAPQAVEPSASAMTDASTSAAPHPLVAPTPTDAPNFPVANAGAALIATDREPGDPSIGRPDIDGSLFTRVPLEIKLSGGWRPLVATIQEISTHDVFMALKNPAVTADRNTISVALQAELLTPEITPIPGIDPVAKPSIAPRRGLSLHPAARPARLKQKA